MDNVAEVDSLGEGLRVLAPLLVSLPYEDLALELSGGGKALFSVDLRPIDLAVWS